MSKEGHALGDHRPRVSVGLPVYNAQRFLREAIEGVLRQSFKEFELIISDNASVDNTDAICREYACRDPRIRYVRFQTNVGAAGNYNRTVELARGEYFRWATYDDLIAPTLLEKCVDVLDRHPEVVLVYPKTINVNEKGEFLEAYEDNFAFRDVLPHLRYRRLMYAIRNYDCNAEYGLIRTEVLRRTAMEQNYHSSDKVLLSELVLHGQFYEIPERLFFHRFHEDISTRPEATAAEITAFMDPKTRGKRVYPKFRRLAEFVRAINRAPLSVSHRLFCYVQIAVFYTDPAKWRRLGVALFRHLKSAVKYPIHRARSGQGLLGMHLLLASLTNTFSNL